MPVASARTSGRRLSAIITPVRAYDLIKRKRDGGRMTGEEFRFLIRGYLAGEVPDYQMAAFLMAVFLRGLDEEETALLTEAMLHSGLILDLSGLERPKVDKHSTGGVGDKVSIVLAPLVASAGVVVPMISGRGLGHTGGTLDKLESIPGFRTEMSLDEFREALWTTGVAIMGQTEEIAPADRRLYALRDVTATVESIPLIASSIMSKKLSEGLDGLVLDVKVGSGAFMKTVEEAEALARVMVGTGNSLGVRTVAVLTDMDEPLGRMVGNSLEIKECINLLKGWAEEDLLEVTLTLGAWMLYIAEEMVSRGAPPAIDDGVLMEKRKRLEGLLSSGKALERFLDMIEAQGGDPEIAARPGLLPGAGRIRPVYSPAEGYIRRVDAEKVGVASVLLGAGRSRMEDGIDHGAGVMLNRKSGTKVARGEPLATLHYNDEGNIEEACRLVEGAFEIGPEPPGRRRLIRKVVLA